jgi:hypothetical protein
MFCRSVFSFLRIVAAVWICSHSEQFEPSIPELSEDLTLRDVSFSATSAWDPALWGTTYQFWIANAFVPRNLTLFYLHLSFLWEQWCFREVIQHKVYTDHVQITALVTALGVPLRVEYLSQAEGLDLYTGGQDDTPRCGCWPGHAIVIMKCPVWPCSSQLLTMISCTATLQMMRAQLVGWVWLGVPHQQIIEVAAVARVQVNRLAE